MFLKIAVPKRKRSVSQKKHINFFFYKINCNNLKFKSIKNLNNKDYKTYLIKYKINFYYHDALSF